MDRYPLDARAVILQPGFVRAARHRYPERMSGRMLLAALITALGAVITLVNLRDGLTFSFPLLLGVLLLADGILRFAMLDRDTPDPADDEHKLAHTASGQLDRASRLGPSTAGEGFARDDVPELRSLPDQRDSTPRPE